MGKKVQTLTPLPPPHSWPIMTGVLMEFTANLNLPFLPHRTAYSYARTLENTFYIACQGHLPV